MTTTPTTQQKHTSVRTALAALALAVAVAAPVAALTDTTTNSGPQVNLGSQQSNPTPGLVPPVLGGLGSTNAQTQVGATVSNGLTPLGGLRAHSPRNNSIQSYGLCCAYGNPNHNEAAAVDDGR